MPKRTAAYTRFVTVTAFWDAEANVWVAESDDVPGLVAEAETIEEPTAKLEVLIPELLELNGVTFSHPAINLVATRALSYAG